MPDAAVPRRLRRVLALQDLEKAARRHLPRSLLGYVAGTTETGRSARDASAAFDEYAFLPHVLTDVSGRSAGTELFGRRYAQPYGIAPMGLAALMAYRGDLALARAAQAAGIPMMLSGSSLIRLEDVARAAPDAWFQAYLPGERPRIARQLDRVAAAGYGTLVLTADVPVLGSRENNVRNGFSTPLRPSLRLAWDGASRPGWVLGTALPTLLRHGMPHFENSGADRGTPIVARNVTRDFGRRDGLDWTHLAFMRERWRGRLVVKGILRPDDARRARDHGVDGIIVSSHGARQLDGAIAPLRVLPEIVRAVGELPVMLDGFVRRGTDVLKVIALGARFVFVGRPFLYAAALGGEAGVRHAIHLLAEEISRDMALLGITSPHAMHAGLLRRV